MNFSSIAKMNFVQLILSLATHFGWLIHKVDIRSSFVHGNLSKEIYMEEPPSFMTYYSLACQLKKSLCGLKQAP